MGILRRILIKKWAWFGAFLTALFLALFVLPLYRYRPTCGGVDLPGPMREDFIEYFEYDMKWSEFFYIRYNDEIFMRFYNPLYIYAKPPRFKSYDDLISNSEKKYSNNFLGYYPKESEWNKHPEAKAARDDGLAWLRDHADDDPAMHRNAVVLRRAAIYCTQFYALVIQTENMPPEQRLRFLPEKSPESPTKR